MHPLKPTRRELGSLLLTKDQETLTKPPILGREIQTLTGHTPRRLPAHETAHSLPTHIQQDDMISKINLLWKAVSKKLDDVPIRDTAGNPAVPMNFTFTNDSMREELRGKGIKSPSKEDETKEEGNVKPSTTEYEDYKMTVESEEEFGEETKDGIEEEEEDSPKHFDTFPIMK
ncbi:hypothetical protein Tco_1308664 [Tanacetum coccineum]